MPTPSTIAPASNAPLVSADPSLVVSPVPSDPDLLFADETLDAASGWRQLNVKRAAFSFASGSLSSTYEKKGSWAYAVRQLAQPETVLRVGGRFVSNGLGYFGWLCGDSATGRYYGAVPETDGSLVFIDGGYGGVEPLERYEDLGAPVVDGSATTMGIECAIDHGTVWLETYLDDGEPIAVHEEEVGDIAHFDVIGMYGESLDPAFTMAVDQISARGTHDGTGSISFAALPLASYGRRGATTAPACVESPAASAAVSAVDCYLQDEGDGPELMELASYSDPDAMHAAYDSDTSRTACPDAPSATLWSRGAVRCLNHHVGIDVQWTDRSLNLVGHLVDYDGDTVATEARWEDIVGTD